MRCADGDIPPSSGKGLTVSFGRGNNRKTLVSEDFIRNLRDDVDLH
jgi:hypothetical protein